MTTPRARILFNLGNAQLEEGNMQAAVVNLEAAYLDSPNQITLQGAVMAALAAQDWSKAVQYGKLACKNDPGFAENWYRLGSAYWSAGNWKKARAAFLKCLEIEEHAGASAQLAMLYGMAGADDLAYRSALAATEVLANSPIEAFQQSTVLLWLGEYAEGWRKYEYRHDLPLVINGWRRPDGLDPAKRWDGKTYVDGPLLLYHEQGHGDAIQMARYHSMLLERCDTLIVLVHGSLVTLFGDHTWDMDVQPLLPGEPAPPHDAYVGAMSLPHIFGTTLDTVPPPADFGMRWDGGRVRDCGCCETEAHRPGPDCCGCVDDRRPRIALCTKGGAVASLDLDRSCHDDSFDRLKALEGYEIIDFTGRTGDYLDTARDLLGCELLVAVDTSIAHLAGSLGVPTWLVPPTHHEWRHLRGAEVNPWYASWKYFRRRKSNDWAFAVDNIIQALEAR